MAVCLCRVIGPAAFALLQYMGRFVGLVISHHIGHCPTAGDMFSSSANGSHGNSDPIVMFLIPLSNIQ